jgi:hypothetical protein
LESIQLPMFVVFLSNSIALPSGRRAIRRSVGRRQLRYLARVTTSSWDSWTHWQGLHQHRDFTSANFKKCNTSQTELTGLLLVVLQRATPGLGTLAADGRAPRPETPAASETQWQGQVRHQKQKICSSCLVLPLNLTHHCYCDHGLTLSGACLT